MKLSKYGIFLERITEADIEIIRQHRNCTEVRQYMHFQDEITVEMQLAWFRRINNYSNHYFLIRVGEIHVGLINIKNICWDIENTYSESGLFLWDLSFYGTHVPLLASLCLSEFGYGFLRGRETFIQVLEENRNAIAFTKMLGYEEVGREKDNLIRLRQTKHNYEKSTENFRKMALDVSDGDLKMYFYFMEEDRASGLERHFVEHSTRFSHNYERKDMGDYTLYAFDFGI